MENALTQLLGFNDSSEFFLPTLIFGAHADGKAWSEGLPQDDSILQPSLIIPARSTFVVPGIESHVFQGSEVPRGRFIFAPGERMGYKMFKGTTLVHLIEKNTAADSAVVLVGGPRQHQRRKIEGWTNPSLYTDGIVPFYAHWVRRDGSDRRPLSVVGPHKIYVARSGMGVLYHEERIHRTESNPEGQLNLSALVIKFQVLSRDPSQPDVVRFKSFELGVPHDVARRGNIDQMRQALLENAGQNRVFTPVFTAMESFTKHCCTSN